MRSERPADPACSKTPFGETKIPDPTMIPMMMDAPSWTQCYKTFYGHNLLMFVLS